MKRLFEHHASVSGHPFCERTGNGILWDSCDSRIELFLFIPTTMHHAWVMSLGIPD